MTHMCTKEELHDELKETVPKLVENALAKKTAKFVWGYWLAMIGVAITASAAWFTLAGEVNNNTQARTVGDRFTAQDGENLQLQIDSIESRQDRFEEWLIRFETKLDIVIDRI